MAAPADTDFVQRTMEIARLATQRAGEIQLHSFHSASFDVDWKTDGTPVTTADRESERVIVETIHAAFPRHTIFAEETGLHEGDPNTRWIVDPLDGTHRFARGLPFWGPLIALQHNGEVIAGAMGLPTQSVAYWAGRGLGCWRNGKRVSVSSETDWSRSNLSLGSISRLLAGPHRAGVLKLIETASYTIAGNDLAGCSMLLDGRAEAWLEAGVQTWDIAPFAVMIEEAGGTFQDFSGGKSIETGGAVGTNAALHEHVRTTLMAGL